jgi:hypothetical protein
LNKGSFIVVIVVGVFVGYAAFAASRLWKYGGFRAAVFGERVSGKLGEVQCSRRFLSKRCVFAYRLDGDPGRAVGLEFAAGISGRMRISLSLAETTKLISLLESTLSY